MSRRSTNLKGKGNTIHTIKELEINHEPSIRYRTSHVEKAPQEEDNDEEYVAPVIRNSHRRRNSTVLAQRNSMAVQSSKLIEAAVQPEVSFQEINVQGDTEVSNPAADESTKKKNRVIFLLNQAEGTESKTTATLPKGSRRTVERVKRTSQPLDDPARPSFSLFREIGNKRNRQAPITVTYDDMEEDNEEKNDEPEAKADSESPRRAATANSLLIDSQILKLKDSSIQHNHEIPTKPTHTNFSKADTGRLGSPTKLYNQLPGKLLENTVSLVGHKVGHDIIKTSTKQQAIELKEKLKSQQAQHLAPIYYKERTKTAANNRKSPKQTIAKPIPNPFEADTGDIKDLEDVDGVLSHFQAILENRRVNLYLGMEEEPPLVPFIPHEIKSKALADEEELIVEEKEEFDIVKVPSHLDILNSESALHANTEIKDVSPTQNESNSNIKTESYDSIVLSNMMLDETEQTSLEHIPTTVIARRDLNSASTNNEKFSFTRSTSRSEWSCSCNTNTCSICISQSNSGIRSKLHSATTVTTTTTTTNQSVTQKVAKLLPYTSQHKALGKRPTQLKVLISKKVSIAKGKGDKARKKEGLKYAKYLKESDLQKVAMDGNVVSDIQIEYARGVERANSRRKFERPKYIAMNPKELEFQSQYPNVVENKLSESLQKNHIGSKVITNPNTPGNEGLSREESKRSLKTNDLEISGMHLEVQKNMERHLADNGLHVDPVTFDKLKKCQEEKNRSKPSVTHQQRAPTPISENESSEVNEEVIPDEKVEKQELVRFSRDVKRPNISNLAINNLISSVPDFVLQKISKKNSIIKKDLKTKLAKPIIEEVFLTSDSLLSINGFENSQEFDELFTQQLTRSNSLDRDIIGAIQQMQINEMQYEIAEQSKTVTFSRKPSVKPPIGPQIQKLRPSSAGPTISKKKLISPRDIRKKRFIKQLTRKVSLPLPELEGFKYLKISLTDEPDAPTKNIMVKKPETTQSEQNMSAISYYTNQRRAMDISRNPHLYAGKTINPDTNQIEILTTLKPIIGICPDKDSRSKSTDDAETLHNYNIRQGLKVNNFVPGGPITMYEAVHNIKRRKVGLSGIDRCKYPTFDDPGPPLDATGTPILKQDGASTPVQQIDLVAELQKINLLIDESKVPIPAYHRKRGALYSRMEKFNRAMEDLDLAIQYGLYKLAIVNYSTVIRLKNDSPDAYFNRACLFEIENEITFANEDYRIVRMLDPNNDQAIHNLAMYSFQRQLWSDAISENTKLILINPENAQAYMYRGRSYAALSFFIDAMEDLTQAIRICPNKSSYFFHRACLLREQNPKAAVEDFSIAILLDNSNQSADAYFHRAIEMNPVKSKALLHLGMLYMRHAKNYHEALKCLNAAITADSTNLKGYIGRGELYEVIYRETLLQLANVKRVTRANKMDAANQYRTLILSFQRKYKQIIDEFDERKKRFKYVDDPALLLIVAKARIRYGDFQGALADLMSAGDQAKDDPQISLQKGICHERLKHWSSASLEFSKCISQMPTFSKAYYHRGLCKIAEGDASGEEDFNVAIQLDPKFFDAYLTRASFNHSNGRFGKAIEDCDEALYIEPTSIAAHILRGTCKSKLDQQTHAILDFSKAISIDKTSHFAYYNRALAYQCAKDFIAAIRDYSIVILLTESMNAYKHRALLYWKLNDNVNAYYDFLAAKNINPTDAKLRTMLGLSLQKVGKYEESKQEFTEALKIDPGMKEAILGRGNVYAAMNNLNMSRRDYCRVLHMYPRTADTFVNIAYTKQTEGLPTEAWKYFTMAYTIDPNCTAALEGRALVNSSMNNPYAAFLDISTAIEISPKNAEFLTNRGVIYEELNDSISALQNYKVMLTLYLISPRLQFKAIKHKSDDPTIYLNRGICNLMLKEYEKSEHDFNMTLELNPDSILAYFNLGKFNEAEAAFTYVINLNPDDKMAYLCRAECRAQQLDWEKAMEDYALHIASTT
ncbi:cytochrome c oxidase subunit 1 [Globomyces sp. JEL0801]|nr:cytochrome c oxidase subunit 1 [Globomyces sp. JEL0801]